MDGKKRVHEFYAMSPEQAYSILETIVVLGGQPNPFENGTPTEIDDRPVEEYIGE